MTICLTYFLPLFCTIGDKCWQRRLPPRDGNSLFVGETIRIGHLTA